MKHARFPSSAPSGMALGGGCEILLHCAAVQASAETYMGLVEVGVGVVPGWGGCKEMVMRWQTNPRRPGGPMPGVAKVFEMISTAYVSTSAEEAKEALFLRESDGITMNRDRLLADAKAKALAMVAAGYQPQESPSSAAGRGGRVALGWLSTASAERHGPRRGGAVAPRASSPAATPTSPRRSPDRSRARARGVPRAGADAGDAGEDRAHAGDGKAAEELKTRMVRDAHPTRRRSS